MKATRMGPAEASDIGTSPTRKYSSKLQEKRDHPLFSSQSIRRVMPTSCCRKITFDETESRITKEICLSTFDRLATKSEGVIGCCAWVGADAEICKKVLSVSIAGVGGRG